MSALSVWVVMSESITTTEVALGCVVLNRYTGVERAPSEEMLLFLIHSSPVLTPTPTP